MRQDSVLLAFGSYQWICENVAVRLALCDLEAPSLGFRIVHLLLPGSQIVVWHFCGLFRFCLGDTMSSSLFTFSNCLWTDQLTTGRAGFCFCSGLGCLLFCVFCLFFCFCVFCVCFLSCTVTLQRSVYRSISVLFCITLSLWPILLLH